MKNIRLIAQDGPCVGKEILVEVNEEDEPVEPLARGFEFGEDKLYIHFYKILPCIEFNGQKKFKLEKL